MGCFFEVLVDEYVFFGGDGDVWVGGDGGGVGFGEGGECGYLFGGVWFVDEVDGVGVVVGVVCYLWEIFFCFYVCVCDEGGIGWWEVFEFGVLYGEKCYVVYEVYVECVYFNGNIFDVLVVDVGDDDGVDFDDDVGGFEVDDGVELVI